jgi:hypothetical protein
MTVAGDVKIYACILPNNWTNAVYTLIGYEPYVDNLGFVTNRLDEPVSDEKFIRIGIGF